MTILSLFCLLSGAVLAGLAPRRSVQQAALESAGGGLIVLGLAWVYHDTGGIKSGTKKLVAFREAIVAQMEREGSGQAPGQAPGLATGLAGLRLGPVILDAMQSDMVFAPVSSPAFWFGERNCWAPAMTPQAVLEWDHERIVIAAGFAED